MRTLNQIFRAAVLGVLLSGISQAQASLTADAHVTVGTGAAYAVGAGAITIDGTSEGNFYLGEITLAGTIFGNPMNPNPYPTVCTDVKGVVYIGSTYWYSDQQYNGTLGGLNPNWGSPKTPFSQATASQAIQNAADIFYKYSGSTTYLFNSVHYTRAEWWAAMQLAVWEELYDTGGTFGLSSGRFSANSAIVGSAAYNLATSWLGTATKTYAGDILIPLKNVHNSVGDPDNGVQGMLYNVTPVPEPTTLIAGALLLLPFGASTFRLVRKNRVR